MYINCGLHHEERHKLEHTGPHPRWGEPELRRCWRCCLTTVLQAASFVSPMWQSSDKSWQALPGYYVHGALQVMSQSKWCELFSVEVSKLKQALNQKSVYKYLDMLCYVSAPHIESSKHWIKNLKQLYQKLGAQFWNEQQLWILFPAGFSRLLCWS